MSVVFDDPVVTFDDVGYTFDGDPYAAGSPVWPIVGDVRLGVVYGPTGADYTGTLSAGGGTYPTTAEISSAVVSALRATTIPVDVKKINAVTLAGAGVSGDPMRPA